MNISRPLLCVLLSLSAPVGSTPALDALKAAAGGGETPQAPAPSGKIIAASLLSLVRGGAICYDGLDRAVHGAPMCAVALSNDPSAPYYVMISPRGRGHQESGVVTVHRETKMFVIGKDALSGYEAWATESVQIVTEADGAVISATRTKAAVYPSQSACPSCAFQPYTVRDASGATKTVLIGRVSAELGVDETRAEIEKAAAAVQARRQA